MDEVRYYPVVSMDTEGVEKQPPRFIAWEEQTSDTVGLSIR